LRVSASITSAATAGKPAAVIEAVLRSINPRTPTEAAIVADEVSLTRGTSDTIDFALPLAAALVAFVCHAWIALPTLLLWAGAVTIVSLGTWYLGRRIDHMRFQGIDAIRRWAQMRTVMTAIYLGTWCTMGIFLWAPGALLNHMFIILILACSLAGANALAAPHPATAAVSTTVHGLVLVLPPLLAGDAFDLALAGLCLIYCFLMIAQARVVHANAKRARQLQTEREALIRDLSDAKAESDRERAAAAAAGRTRAEFLSNMNHELRTPMNAILGFSELIKTRAFGSDVEKYAEYAAIIHDSGRHLLTLINEMLDLAKIEGGKLSLRESVFDLRALMRDVVGEHEDAAKAGGLSFSLKIAGQIPHTHADERAIRQILVNLVANALKFTKKGGSVSVFGRVEEDGRLAFGVEDDGIGIAPEDQVHVFERFGRGRHDVTATGKGTGLGLAIVKGFAEAHDGEVRLESDRGKGTRVTVFLPRARVVAAGRKKAV
jgi:two-component system, cell cycle sensor histidine kinase PleC